MIHNLSLIVFISKVVRCLINNSKSFCFISILYDSVSFLDFINSHNIKDYENTQYIVTRANYETQYIDIQEDVKK